LSFFYFYDPYIWVLLVCVVISGYAQHRINSTFNRFSKITTNKGYTGAFVAQDILRRNSVSDVRVEQGSGTLTDHFDPRRGLVKLSDPVYRKDSIAANAVAAHEIGHVLQKKEGYGFYKLRTALVPVTNFGSKLAIPLIFIGLLMNNYTLAQIGVIAYGAILLFQLVTLPVEFNASRRALAQLDSGGYLDASEQVGARKVLNAAALTYVAATLVSLLQILRLFAMVNRRRR
jgi:Zn-dependent membrane protease YugP